MNKTIKIKRGLKVNLPVLAEGELGFVTDQKKLYIGTANGNQQVSIEQDIIDSLLIDNQINSEAIDKLEATINKIDLGLDKDTVSGEDILSLGADVLASPGEVLVEGVSLYSKQLLLNPNFEGSLTSWKIDDIPNSYDNGKIKIEKPMGSGTVGYLGQKSVLTANKKYIAVFKIVDYISGTPTGYWNATENQIDTVTQNGVYTYSFKASQDFFYFQFQETVSNYYSFDYVYLFELDALIANKQYSPLYNKTFNLLSISEARAQLKAWVLDGTLPNDEIQSVGGSKRIKSVGKNLFDGKWEEGSISSTGLIIPDTYRIRGINFIGVKPSQALVCNKPMNFVYLYDANKTFIQRIVLGMRTYTIPSNVYYIKIVFQKNEFINYPNDVQIQLEESPSATPYQPYISNDLYLDSLPNLNRLPNGVKDTIEYRNGKYYYVQRVQEYVLQAADIVTMDNSSYNTGAVITGYLFSDGVTFTDSVNDYALIPGMVQMANFSSNYNNVDNVGKYSTRAVGVGSSLSFCLVKGTTLAQARTALAGTVIYYQLATPIETEITSIGTLLPQPNGTVYITNESAEIAVYTDKFTATRVIKEITELYLLNPDGSKTKLTGAVLTNNTFTHASLTEGDLVFVSYIYAALDGRTTLTYKKDNIARKSELDLKADATNKATILGSGTMTDITNEVTDPRLIAPKVIKDYAEPKVSDSGWITLSLRNGWEHHATFPLRIRKIGNAVYLRGRLVGTNATGQSPCVIPVGYQIGSNQGGSDMIGSIDTYVFGRLDNNISSIYLNITNYTTITIWLNSTWLID